MAAVVFGEVILMYGRAARFDRPDAEMKIKIAEAAAATVGETKTEMERREKRYNAIVRETLLLCLREITSKAIPLVEKDEPILGEDGKPQPGADGKPLTMKVIDEDATLAAIRDEKDAAEKGVQWMTVGHLDMITAGGQHELKKLLPDLDEREALFMSIGMAGVKKPLPLSGRPRMVTLSR